MTQLLHAKRVEVIFAFSLSCVSLPPLSSPPKHTDTNEVTLHYYPSCLVCVHFNGPVCCLLNRCHNTGTGAEEAAAENQSSKNMRQWKNRPHRAGANYKDI